MGGTSSVSRAAVNMSGEVAQKIKQEIKDNRIIIYSKSYCPYCKLAKNAFNDLETTYKVVELDKEVDGSEMQDVLDQMTGARTVPRVFVGGKCIGGGTETRNMLKSGELKQLIDATAN